MKDKEFITIQGNLKAGKLKQYAKDNNYILYILNNKRADMDKTKEIYLSRERAIVVIENIDRSLCQDALLNISEFMREDFILICTYDILDNRSPLIQRSRNLYNNNISEEYIRLANLTKEGKTIKVSDITDVISYLKALASVYYNKDDLINDTYKASRNIERICNTIRGFQYPNINKEIALNELWRELE